MRHSAALSTRCHAPSTELRSRNCCFLWWKTAPTGICTSALSHALIQTNHTTITYKTACNVMQHRQPTPAAMYPTETWDLFRCTTATVAGLLLLTTGINVQQHKTRWCEYCWKEVTCEQLQLRFIRYHVFWKQTSLSRFFFFFFFLSLLLFLKTLSLSCKYYTSTF